MLCITLKFQSIIMKHLITTILIVISSNVVGQDLQNILNEYKDSLTNYGIVALVDNGEKIQTAQIGWAYEN